MRLGRCGSHRHAADAAIAHILNERGLHTGAGEAFDAVSVQWIRFSTEMRDKLAKLRAELAPDDQSLLIPRISRSLSWREIAWVLTAEGDADTSAAIDKRAAALRKRFERLKEHVKAHSKELDSEA